MTTNADRPGAPNPGSADSIATPTRTAADSDMPNRTRAALTLVRTQQECARWFDRFEAKADTSRRPKDLTAEEYREIGSAFLAAHGNDAVVAIGCIVDVLGTFLDGPGRAA